MQNDTDSFHFPPERSESIAVLLAGIVISTIAAALAWLVANYLIAAVICRNNNEGLCADPFTLSYNIFLIIGAMAATGWFAYSRIFRPALVTLPAVIMFWSLPVVISSIAESSIFTFSVISVLLVTFSYLVFYWLVRVRNFVAVFVLWLALTLGVRMLVVA